MFGQLGFFPPGGMQHLAALQGLYEFVVHIADSIGDADLAGAGTVLAGVLG